MPQLPVYILDGSPQARAEMEADIAARQAACEHEWHTFWNMWDPNRTLKRACLKCSLFGGTLPYKPDQARLNEHLGNATMGCLDGFQWIKSQDEWYWFKPIGFNGQGPDGALYVNGIAQEI